MVQSVMYFLSKVTSCKEVFQQDEIAGIIFVIPASPPDHLINKWKNENGQIGSVSGKFTLNLILDEEFLEGFFSRKCIGKSLHFTFSYIAAK